MQLPQEVKMTRKSLVRWLALSMGLVSPNESRTMMLELLEALFHFQFSEKKDPDVPDLMAFLEKEFDRSEDNEKAIRYHLLQLQNLGLIERKKGSYSFATAPLAEKGDFSATVDYVYKRRCENSLAKMKEAGKELKYLLSKSK